MNVFFISPGRTATTTISEAFSHVPGFTSSHESLVQELGEYRVDYPENHFECDNRLTWFLPRLTEKYGDSVDSLLVIVKRHRSQIAASYDQRWDKINIMKSYSQGILLRPLSANNIQVCEDYVDNVYEQLEFAVPRWKNVITMDLSMPEPAIRQVCAFVGSADVADQVLSYFQSTRSNQNNSGFLKRASVFKFNFENLLRDLFR